MDQVTLRNIEKRYGDHIASASVSFSIPRGSIFGLLGPNGAGKTTLIRMITRITMPDSGQVLFGGEPLREEHTSRIGYMPEERGLYKTMKVYEHLIYLARLKNLSGTEAANRVNQWLDKFEIAGWKQKKIEELSKGMAQKVQFIATVLHDPDLLILDEPFSGLDPINAKLIEDEIYALRQQGKTIIFSTHRMEQVEDICDQIVLIDQGHKILEGEVAELKQRFKEDKYHITFDGVVGDDFAETFDVQMVTEHEATVHSRSCSNDILKYFLDRDITIRSYSEILPSLNEIFIRAVNEPKSRADQPTYI
ncbi:MAG: ATP-binding cassette domain-containing protein [Bacteroidetes bacterium]|nr:ATP-binding cassette domain-containing protein [Bacteroidota bacterium]